MALVVFLRGVNVGKHRRFQPAALARELARLDVVNVGAAGTFVVRGTVGQEALRAELARRLPFEAELMICPSRDVLDLLASVAPGREAAETTRYVSVLASRPRALPPLPLSRPQGREWQVKVMAVRGRFALSLHRRRGRTLVYPNEVVEKALGVAATTRNWSTLETIGEILRG